MKDYARSQLDLPVLGKQSAQLADGAIRELNVVGPVEVRFENRYTSCNALVLPGENQVLLGAIPMEDMGMTFSNDPSPEDFRKANDEVLLAHKRFFNP